MKKLFLAALMLTGAMAMAQEQPAKQQQTKPEQKTEQVKPQQKQVQPAGQENTATLTKTKAEATKDGKAEAKKATPAKKYE
jgi:hypothetical protein